MKKRINISKKSLFLATAVVFFAAVLTGFISESKATLNSETVNRRTLMTEMARVQKVLKPVLKNTGKIKSLFFPSNDLPEELESVISSGIIKSLPNGTWRMNETISRGEGLYYLGKLVSQIAEDMQKAPLIVECEHQFNDIPSLHWLNQTLKNIAGTGALEAYKERYLLPDEPMNKSELKALSSQLINYFGSNMLISIFDGTNLFVRTKGALRDIQLVGWSYSLDGKSWEKLNTEGKISFKLAPTTALRISFKHPIFMESKPIVLEMSHPSLNLIKLKRNYANFTKDSFSGRVPVKAGYSNNARAKLKEKLAEIKRKRLEEQPHKRLTNAVPQKVEKSRVAIPIFTKKHTEKPLTKKEEKISKYNLAESSSESSRHLLEETSRIRASSEKNKEEEKELDEAVISETIPAIETATMEKKLSGKVINSITGKPISSAIVVFAGKHLITNQYGEFFYTGKHNQAFEITIYCEGYRPLRLKHRIRYRKEPLTIALKPTLLKFSGRVISLNSGIPVAKAVVKVGELNVRSSVDGTFTLSGLKPGYHQLSCFAEGFLDAHEIVYISKDKENTNFNLELKAIYDENIYFTESEISEVDPDEILRRTDPSVNQARWILKE